ncbi:hypothetical protein CYMTET_39559 [Cymbomonas tetramitiformis]|uniref:Reverse transcriptase domain-containing protein n=1 Tax=Cymbomonas tetramitiformis TaxID=36881 RepID=A0AAE0CB27_9CHLO|nr:hypothetical protein CYMTET_39559 [Cymbomonas tetramitiformis]
MAASNVGLAIWAAPGMKVHLQALLKISELPPRARMATWQKQRTEIMTWVTEHVSELQEIPDSLGSLTDALIAAELFSVDASGALILGAWPAEPGAWATRKAAEMEKLDAVLEWAQAMLALRVPVPASAALGTVTGGGGASGGGGAPTSSAPASAGGSGAGASAGGGPGGGAPSGAAGAHGGLGTGTIATAIAASGAGASVLVPSTTATIVGTGGTTGSAAGGGPGGGAPAGAAGAHGALSVGTVASATAASGAAAVADPQSIAAAIAAAIGAKLDAFGERLASLEAQRSAAGGAPVALSGVEPPEAKELRCAIRDSVATAEDWDMPRCVQACTDLVHEAATLRPQLTALRGVHPFGKAPMRTLEAHAFEPLVFILPELRVEECELDELPPGSEATLEHWRAFVHLLQARVGEFQRFVKSHVPTLPVSDVMVPTFFRKRKRVSFTQEEEEARAAGGGHGALPVLDHARRGHLAALGEGFRTVNEEQLARALRGELAPEDVVRPPGAGPPLTAIPSRGPLAGIDLVVSPVQRLLQEDEGKLKLKDGELTVVPKKKKCKDFAEWERGFLRVLCEAPVESRDDLVDFIEWARTIAAEFSFHHFSEFYEHLVRQVQRSATGISLDGYDRVWRVYRQANNLQEKKPKAPRDRYTWRRDAAEKTTVPDDAGGGKGKGKGAGGRGGGGRGGRGGRGEGLIPAVAVPLEEPASSKGAPAGAEGVPALPPDPMVGACAELILEQPVVVEASGAVDAQEGCGPPDVGDGGGVPLVPPCGVDMHGSWWTGVMPDEFIPVWDVLGGPRRHGRAPMAWETERLAPLPVTQLSPDTWASPSEPWRVRVSTRWPLLRDEILRRATVETMEACGTSEGERRCYEEECLRVGCMVPTLTRRAHIVAAAFSGWHDVDFLVRCAACGAGWPSEEIELDEPYRVPNYVGPEHVDVMREELRREQDAGHIFLAGWRLPLGVIALNMVEKVRKGKVKYRPVSDYSRPADVGVNARIELEHDEFTTVKEAYGMLRPGYWMVKVDLESAYRSLGVASQFWPHQCFEFDDVRWMDARAPFGNRALPGIFMRWTRAIVAWMRARGYPTVGYLDDFFCVLPTKQEAEEAMMLLVEFVTFLGFQVNSAKCEEGQVLEFLGVLLDTSGEVCTASISEERIGVVVQQAGALRAQAARGMVARRALESLLGLLAFCSHVVWGLSLYTRRGFSFLAATTSRRMVRLPRPVMDDLSVLEQVVRRYNGRKVQLERRLVDQRHFATDASGTLGFGGIWERLFFMLSWDDLARLPQRPWFPRRGDCPSSWSINYLELFAVWWALVLWGHRMSGTTVVVRIDNQSAMYQVGSWWGPVAYLPLLRQIFFVCAQHDIRLQPVYITTKDNLLADLLSRLDMPSFLAERKAFLRADIWRQDRDDWMVCPKFDGHNAWGNLPFSIMFAILKNFLKCKRRQQWGTAACFLELQREAERYRAEALAPETRRCYGTGVRAFVTFCITFACLGCLEPLLPATDETLCMFVTFCSWFVQPGTIKNYLAGVRQLHLQRGHEWVPVAARHAVAATLQGVKRCWGKPPRPVMPLTSADLAKMAVLISSHDLGQEALWAAILVGFFGLFRKDNLTTGKAGAWNTRGSLLCPVRALMRLMERTAGRQGDSALFVMEKDWVEAAAEEASEFQRGTCYPLPQASEARPERL